MRDQEDDKSCQITIETLPGIDDLQQILVRAQGHAGADVRVLFSPTSEQLATILQSLSSLNILSLSVNNILDPANIRASKLHELVDPAHAELSLQNYIFIYPEDFVIFYAYINKYRVLTVKNCKLSMAALQVIVDSTHYGSQVYRLELDQAIDLYLDQSLAGGQPGENMLSGLAIKNSTFFDESKLMKVVTFDNLHHVCMYNVQLVNEYLKTLMANFRSVETLDVSCNFLTDIAIECLGHHSFETVCLDNNYITSAGFETLVYLVNDGRIKTASVEENLIVLSRAHLAQYKSALQHINIKNNPVGNFSFPVSNYVLINNYHAKNFTLRLKSATEYYNNLNEIRKMALSNSDSVVSKQLMDFQNIVLTPEVMVRNSFQNRFLLSRIVDFRLLDLPQQLCQNMSCMQLQNIRFLQISNSLLSYISCFPKLFCLEIKCYDGSVLRDLPESTRVLIVREYDNCNFWGNVALVQTATRLIVHPAVYELFSEYQDVSKIPIRYLFRLGIIPVGDSSDYEEHPVLGYEYQYDDSEVPEETEEVDFEQWTRCGLVKTYHAAARYNSKKRHGRSSDGRRDCSELNSSGNSDVFAVPKGTSTFRVETTFPSSYLENTVSVGEVATTSYLYPQYEATIPQPYYAPYESIKTSFINNSRSKFLYSGQLSHVPTSFSACDDPSQRFESGTQTVGSRNQPWQRNMLHNHAPSNELIQDAQLDNFTNLVYQQHTGIVVGPVEEMQLQATFLDQDCMDVSKKLVGQHSDIVTDRIEEKEPVRLIRVPLKKTAETQQPYENKVSVHKNTTVVPNSLIIFKRRRLSGFTAGKNERVKMYTPRKERQPQTETKASETQTIITAVDPYDGRSRIPSYAELQKLAGADYAYVGCVLKTDAGAKIVQTALLDNSVQKDCDAVQIFDEEVSEW